MKVMKHLNKWWLYYMILAWQWIKILVKKKLKSIYFKFIRFYDCYTLVTKGLKWLTVSMTLSLVGRINLSWKQIDAPVGFGCKLYIYTLLCKIESAVRKIKVNIVFEMINFQWGFNAIFVVPFSLTLTHENVRGLGTKYILWAIKMLWKGQNLHGPLKIPR